jgi:DNA repair exonuclease SbcCD nuclease subunit
MSMKSDTRKWEISRRTFLRASAATVAALALPSSRLAFAGEPPSIRFGLVTDPHYADREPNGSRQYRESIAKLTECVELMNDKKVAFLVETGDFKDQDTPPKEERTLAYLKKIEAVFQKFNGPTYHALGNHDLDSLSKVQFLANVENTGIAKDRSYYSFDQGWLHVVVLDPNFNPDESAYDHGNYDWTDANIPPKELAWLEKDLASTSKPVIAFTHQLLDGVGNPYVTNAEAVRKVLEKSGNVLAVFQGHHHDGSHKEIAGIHYYTLKAMIEGSGEENSAYATVDVKKSGDIIVTGYRRAVGRKMVHA